MHRDLTFAASAKTHTQACFWEGDHQCAVTRVDTDLVGRRVDTTSTSYMLQACSSRVLNPSSVEENPLYDGKKTTTTSRARRGRGRVQSNVNKATLTKRHVASAFLLTLVLVARFHSA